MFCQCSSCHRKTFGKRETKSHIAAAAHSLRPRNNRPIVLWKQIRGDATEGLCCVDLWRENTCIMRVDVSVVMPAQFMDKM